MRERERVTVKFTKPSLAQQSFKDECDINNIMAKYERTGMIEHVNQFQGQYGDFIGFPDYHQAMNAVKEAESMFMTLPSSIRERFNNNPETFLAFAQDENNQDEMIRMGLIPAPRPPSSMPSNGEAAPAKPVKPKAKAQADTTSEES